MGKGNPNGMHCIPQTKKASNVVAGARNQLDRLIAATDIEHPPLVDETHGGPDV